MIIDDNTHLMRIESEKGAYLATIRSYVYSFSFDVLDQINKVLKSYEKYIATPLDTMTLTSDYEFYEGEDLVATMTVFYRR